MSRYELVTFIMAAAAIILLVIGLILLALDRRKDKDE